MRQSDIARKTGETDIGISLCLDGNGEGNIDTHVGFLDHTLTAFAKHSGFDLSVRCEGDTQVDDHHSVEDIGIALGQAFKKALGDKRGIRRYGSICLPMDEALILCAIDISGRAHLSFSVDIPTPKVGTFDTELVKEFFLGFVRSAEITLHINKLAGENSHHIIEACFKAFARSLGEAARIDLARKNELPSTKGVL